MIKLSLGIADDIGAGTLQNIRHDVGAALAAATAADNQDIRIYLVQARQSFGIHADLDILREDNVRIVLFGTKGTARSFGITPASTAVFLAKAVITLLLVI